MSTHHDFSDSTWLLNEEIITKLAMAIYLFRK